MSDTVKTEFPNPNPDSDDRPMAETDQSPPESEPSKAPTTTTEAADGRRTNNYSVSIWPPADRTREAVRNRLIETLSAPSILSKRYGTVPREEAVDAAKIIEEEAFEVAGKEATPDGDGIPILQIYSKEISKRMLERVKARSGESGTASTTEQANEAPPSKAPAEDAAPTEKTDSIAGDE